MAGYDVVNIPSGMDGCVDLEKLRAAAGPDTAASCSQTRIRSVFSTRIYLEITKIVHDAGGLCYYDGANLNAVMGVVRPGDMGFDVIHLNLHKTFATPHGGGGPGSGPVGCKEYLEKFFAGPVVVSEDGRYAFKTPVKTIGAIKAFYGNFLVVVKALTYILTLGREGIPAAAKNAVLNANYMMKKLSGRYEMAYNETCMHEFVMSLEREKKGVRHNGYGRREIASGLRHPSAHDVFPAHRARGAHDRADGDGVPRDAG